MDKIKKLNELNLLLKSGAITEKEFDILKKEALTATGHQPIAPDMGNSTSVTENNPDNDEAAEYQNEGFNYPGLSILSVLCSGLSLFVIMISPCLIFIIGGSCFLCGLYFSVAILNKADATKLDKTLAYLALMLSAISAFMFVTWNS